MSCKNNNFVFKKPGVKNKRWKYKTKGVVRALIRTCIHAQSKKEIAIPI